MTMEQLEDVYAGEIDYVDGEWIDAASPHTPAHIEKGELK
jgi:hypothetical protein